MQINKLFNLETQWQWEILIVAALLGGFLLLTYLLRTKQQELPPTKDHWLQYTRLFLQRWQLPLVVTLGTILICIILPEAIKKLPGYTQFTTIITISIFTWLAIQTIKTIRDIIIKRAASRTNNMAALRIETQVDILVRIATLALLIIGISLVLTTFPQIRKIGVSILASAGIAGIALGFAAQKSLSNILAGAQIALTQPIKLGDHVVVGNDGGIIEEINFTYVVMRTMDKRRFIIPIQYFIDNIFQNWTRNSSELLGIVYLEVDYGTPIEKIRAELDAILAKTPLWDKKVKTLEVTEAKTYTIELRILASATNLGNAWKLRCYIREQLIMFLQKNYPDSLPRIKVELKNNLK